MFDRLEIGRIRRRCQQHARQQRADYIHPSARVPIVFAMASLAALCISVDARHVVRKAIFINVNNWFGIGLMRRDPLLEDGAPGVARVRMRQCLI